MTHSEMVSRLVKSGKEIHEGLSPEKCDLLHAVLGIAGESGELVDAIKKYVIYNKPLDFENMVEELGDMEFYMEQLRQALGLTRQYTIDENMAKLAKRYPNFSYTDQRAHERADKVVCRHENVWSDESSDYLICRQCGARFDEMSKTWMARQ